VTPGPERIGFLKRPAGLDRHGERGRPVPLPEGMPLEMSQGGPHGVPHRWGPPRFSLCSGPIVRGSPRSQPDRGRRISATRPAPGKSRWRPDEGKQKTPRSFPRAGFFVPFWGHSRCSSCITPHLAPCFLSLAVENRVHAFQTPHIQGGGSEEGPPLSPGLGSGSRGSLDDAGPCHHGMGSPSMLTGSNLQIPGRFVQIRRGSSNFSATGPLEQWPAQAFSRSTRASL